MSFSDYLKSLRETHDLTQEQAADKLKVSVPTIQNWENNRSTPDFRNLEAISKMYQIDISDILQALGRELNGYERPKEQPILTCPWIDLLPDDFDYQKLESLRLSALEVEILRMIKLGELLGGDTLSRCLALQPDSQSLLKTLQTLTEAGVIKRRELALKYQTSIHRIDGDEHVRTPYRLTADAEMILLLTEEQSNRLARLYQLPFAEFIDVVKAFGLLAKNVVVGCGHDKGVVTYQMDEVLERITSEDVLLDTYAYQGNEDGCEMFKHKDINQWVFALDSSYYTLESYEWDDDSYLEARKTYLEWEDHCHTHPEFLEKFNKLPILNQVLYRKVVPTEKAYAFMAAYQSSDAPEAK